MTITSTYRGNKITFDEKGWNIDIKDEICNKCKRLGTAEGHDVCLGTLSNVRFACCGHGNDGEAYIIFNDGCEVRGIAALKFMGK